VNALALDALSGSGQSIALWGWGREGRAAYRALRTRSRMALTLFCSETEAANARALEDPALSIDTNVSAARLSAFDLVIKSPGISPYRADAREAAAHGTRFIGGTAIWFATRPEARTICVTGSKGKSTTTALLAHLLRALGVRTALAGNIGLPLLELVDADADLWAIELSSYQTLDVAASGVRPEIAIVTNIFPEHLDWHGDEARYIADKLALFTAAKPGIAVLNANDPHLAALQLNSSRVCWFNHRAGWHLRGQWLYRGESAILDTTPLPLPGRHNHQNLCAVLTALDALRPLSAMPSGGFAADALTAHLLDFTPLPHRLHRLGEQDGITWVNDSISTTPHATLAALEVYRGRRIALILGGFDRGLDWSHFASSIQADPPDTIILSGQTSARLAALLSPLADRGVFRLQHASDLAHAVTIARTALNSGGGIVLLSPGAPSFDTYRDYTERGQHFAELAGCASALIHTSAGIGISPS